MLIAGLIFAVAALPVGPAQAKGWTTDANYPKEALRNGWEGVSHFELKVSAEGRVTECKITQTSGYKVLDDETCSMLTRRARFTPAMDSDGKPREATYASKITWQIPD